MARAKKKEDTTPPRLIPKPVRTRTYRGSLIGQVIFKNNLTYFL